MISRYRKLLGLTQREMADIFNISLQAYWQKENGKVHFNDKEKVVFKNMLKQFFPEITIDEIFFN